MRAIPAAAGILLCLTGATAGVWFLPQPAVSLTGDLTNDPAGVIEKYVSLDKRGARLTASSYEAVRPYAAWGEEPAWEQIVVIRDYAVAVDVTQWVVVGALEAVIPVTFQVLGAVRWDTASFEPAPREETLDIRIRAVNNFWKIVAPQFPPHVGRARLKDFVKDARLRESDAARAGVLRRLEDDLAGAGR